MTGARKIRLPAMKNTTTQKQLETNNKVCRENVHQAAASLIIRDHDDIHIIMPGDFLHRVAALIPNIARTCTEKASVLYLTFMDSR